MFENGHPLAHLGLCKYLFRTYAAILFGLTAQNAHITATAVPALAPIRIGIIRSIYAALSALRCPYRQYAMFASRLKMKVVTTHLSAVSVRATRLHYNEVVGSRTGRSLVVRREESPNSAEQCAG